MSSLTPSISREVRRIDTMPFDELPGVLFKEEVKFLYDDRERLRSALESSDRRHRAFVRETKLKLANLRNEVMKHRNYAIQHGRVSTGYDTIMNHITGITRSMKV